MKRISILLFGLLIAGNSFQLKAQDITLEDFQKVAIIDQKVMVPMRDGVRLSTDIYRPKTGAPVPVIFERTPYNFNAYRDGKLNTGKFKKSTRPFNEDMPMLFRMSVEGIILREIGIFWEFL